MTETDSTRRARIETTHSDDATARLLARAIRPDNTAEMETNAVDNRLVTTIARDSTGGLHSSIDDYVVNLHLAEQLLDQDGDSSTTTTRHTHT